VFTSPSGAFALVGQSTDERMTLLAHATLETTVQRLPKPRWTETLPHEIGPRRAVVTDEGVAVLIDEWINVPS